MSAIELKKLLISKIEEIDDVSFLEALKKILERNISSFRTTLNRKKN